MSCHVRSAVQYIWKIVGLGEEKYWILAAVQWQPRTLELCQVYQILYLLCEDLIRKSAFNISSEP